METHFIALMPHTVTIETIDTHTSYGVPEYGTSTSAYALVDPTRQRIITRQGAEVLSRGVAYCAGPLTVAEDAVITVPIAFGFPSRMPVLRAASHADPTGSVHNVEVWF